MVLRAIFTLSILLIALANVPAVVLGDDSPASLVRRTPLPDGPPGEVRVFRGHTVHIPSVAFLPDGRRVMSCSYDGTRVWDVESGERVLDIKPGGLAAMHPTGKEIAIRFGSAIRIYDAQSGKVLRALDPQPTDVASTMEFSADGRWLAAVGKDRIVRIWDAITGKRVWELRGHTAAVRAVAFSPDGKFLISGGTDNTIRVFNRKTGRELRQFIQPKGGQLTLEFSPDGRYVLSGGYYTDVMLWSFERGTVVRNLRGHIASVHRAVFAPDGRRAVTACDDKTVRCWDLQTGRELARFEGHKDYVLDVSVSPDGRFAASVSGGDNEDGKWVKGDDFTVRIWRLPSLSGQSAAPASLNLVNIEGGRAGEYTELGGIENDVLALDLSRDGRLLATGEKNGTVRIWELEGNRPLARLKPHDDLVRAVAFSPDGRRLVTGTQKKQLRLWDVKSRRQLLVCPDVPSQILCAEFLADGRRVVFGVHGSVRIWDTDSNTVTTLKPHAIHPHSVAASDDGRTVAAAAHNSLIYVWDVATGELLHSLSGHTNEVMGVDFGPDGLKLASSSRDKTVRLWDVESGKLIRTFHGHTNWVYGVSFLSDGRRLMSGGSWQDGSIRMWDIAAGKQIWRQANDSKITRHIKVTPDARFAVVANSASVSVLRLPGLRNMTELEAYELARRNEGPNHRVAVLEFVDQGPSVELAPLRTAIAEVLTARLSQYRRVDAVERSRVDQFLKETSLGASGLVDSKTAQRAGKVLTADYLLSGSFSGREGAITINATLSKVGAEKPLARWIVSGPAGDLFQIEQDLAARTLKALGVKNPKLDTPAPAQAGPSPHIAVFSFRNLGQVASRKGAAEKEKTASRLDAMQTGIGEFLQATLSALPNVNLVDREDLDAILKEQKLTMAGLSDAQTAARIGKIAGAGRLIYGSFLQSGDKLTVVARLADTETAAVLHTELADGTSEDIASMLEQLALRLATRMNLERPQDAAQLLRRAVPIRKLEAAIYGSRAMSLVRKGNFDAAFADFDRALLVEPDNLDLRQQYVRALYRLGRTTKLIEVADETLAMKIPQHRRSLKSTIYAYYLNSLLRANQHAKRVEVARRFAKEFPDNSYQQRRARAAEARSLRGSNRRREAIALLEAEVMKAEATGDDVTYGNELAELLCPCSKRGKLIA